MGAMTFRVITLSITILGKMTLSITTLSIMTFSIKDLFFTLSIKYTYYNDTLHEHAD